MSPRPPRTFRLVSHLGSKRLYATLDPVSCLWRGNPDRATSEAFKSRAEANARRRVAGLDTGLVFRAVAERAPVGALEVV